MTRSYLNFLAGRVGQAVITVWLTYSASFIMVSLLPGDPITRYLTAIDAATPETIAALQEYYAYDRPAAIRYLTQLGGLLGGDFGYSFRLGLPVAEVVAGAVGSTLRLAALALAIAMALTGALVLAIATLAPGGRAGVVLRSVPAICSALPPFWLGLVALSVFAAGLRVMSIYPDGSFLSILVPATVLGIAVFPPVAEVALRRFDDLTDEGFIQLARARGEGPFGLLRRHYLRNMLNPVLAILGVTFGSLISGAVVTETIFSRSGIGAVLLEAVTTSDVPLVQGFVLLIAVGVTVINLTLTAVQPAIDPRLLTRRGAL